MSTNQNSNAGEQSSDDSLSAEEFFSSRVKAHTESEATEQETEVEPEEAEFEESEEAEDGLELESEESEIEGDDEEESEEAGNQEIDILSLEPEQIQELATKARSRLLSDLSEQRKKNRELQRQVEELKVSAPASTKVDSVMPLDPNNRFSKPIGELKTPEEVRSKMEELETLFSHTTEALKNANEFDDDVVVQGQTFRKKDIEAIKEDAMNALVKLLPTREKDILRRTQVEAASSQYLEAAMNEVPDIDDPESEVGKFYSTLVADPLIEQVKTKIPELGAQIEYILAHAANSIRGNARKVRKGAGNKLTVKLPSSPVGSSTGSMKGGPKKAIESARLKAEKSGLENDWSAYRTLLHSS